MENKITIYFTRPTSNCVVYVDFICTQKCVHVSREHFFEERKIDIVIHYDCFLRKIASVTVRGNSVFKGSRIKILNQ